MTPLIAEMMGEVIKTNPNFPEHFHWFDISDVPIKADGMHFKEDINSRLVDTPLPFDKVAIVLVDGQGNKASILVSQKHELKREGIVGQAQIKHVDGSSFMSPMFIYRAVDNENGGALDLEVLGLDKKGKLVDDLTEKEKLSLYTSLGYIATFLDSLSYEARTGYQATRRKNHEKRVRQGKFPLFDWQTVVVEPIKPKAEHQGGTHASPRQHERRGHWRFIKKSQKRVWIKNCTVGDASKGVIFHDYKIGPDCKPRTTALET